MRKEKNRSCTSRYLKQFRLIKLFLVEQKEKITLNILFNYLNFENDLNTTEQRLISVQIRCKAI